MKSEFTAEEEARVFEALKHEPEWMRVSFSIAMLTALRFQETRIARNQIRWVDDDILIEKPKGGRRREFAIPIYDSLRPLL